MSNENENENENMHFEVTMNLGYRAFINQGGGVTIEQDALTGENPSICLSIREAILLIAHLKALLGYNDANLDT